ncbi:MAG: serpin family protein [Oscillospiraceae bacterium]
MNNSLIKRIFIGMTAAAIASAAASCGEVEQSAAKPASDTESVSQENTQTESASESAPQTNVITDPSDTESISSSQTEQPEQSEQTEQPSDFFTFKKGIRDFSIDLFKETALDEIENGENVLISPESVIMALGMTKNGAAGDTYTELSEVISGGVTLDCFNENMLALMQKSQDNEFFTMNIANSVWLRDSDSIKLNDSFAERVNEFFGAGVFIKPFDDSTVGEINGWVNDSTNGMIPDIINSLSPDDVAVLINAVAFEAEWADKYEDFEIDENGSFTAADGSEQTVTMLTRCSTGSYFSSDTACGFVSSYMDGQYDFMAILPNEDISLSEYISSLDGDSFYHLYNDRDTVMLNSKLPEFTYDYDTKLVDPLKKMGVNALFDPSCADLSEMADVSGGRIYVSDIIHKTHIELDRNGTRAAAATAIVGKTSGGFTDLEEKTVYLDRPFLYAIVDTETAVPVFIGTVNSIPE